VIVVIKAVIFDFFGVLVTEGFKLFRDTHFPGDETKWRQATRLVNRHDAGDLSWENFCSQLAAISGKSARFVSKNLNTNQPNRQLLDYIKYDLKKRYKIGVLSNSGGDHINRLLDPEDVAIFDDIVLSYRHKMIKPQREIFELAAERLGVQTKECIFVDDSSSHCAGAKRAGMNAVWYRDFKQMKKELERLLSPGSDN
jgi:HAD superfamily hydrolase (TIGR01509 family)